MGESNIPTANSIHKIRITRIKIDARIILFLLVNFNAVIMEKIVIELKIRSKKDQLNSFDRTEDTKGNNNITNVRVSDTITIFIFLL
jgi:hypothetical protein